jgi:hypothetical protein
MGEEPEVRELRDADADGEGHSEVEVLAAVYPGVVILYTAIWAFVSAFTTLAGIAVYQGADVTLPQVFGGTIVLTGIAIGVRLLRFSAR